MFQLHFARGSAEDFRAFVEGASERIRAIPSAKALFHLYNDTAVRDVSDEAVDALRAIMPHAQFVGSSTSANISDGALVDAPLPNLSACCTVFEDPSTNVEVHQFAFTPECREQLAADILALVDGRPWVKAVEIVTTLIDVGMSDFCVDISRMRDDVVVFGGAALTSESIDLWAGLPYVFSSEGQPNGRSIVLVLYGGPDFHVHLETIYGWKPLGPHLAITKADGAVLYELDGMSAFDRYSHYLSVENDMRFSRKAIIFPLAIDTEGGIVIKAPAKVNDDKSITLTSDLAPYHRKCRITYGDPGTILSSVSECSRILGEFGPQAILAFSCAARLMYWGEEDVSMETLPFQDIAPTFGFYTGSEFSRKNGRVMHHNVTLVVAGMREGGPQPGRLQSDSATKRPEFNRQMAIVDSLAAFVGITSSELEDAYRRMRLIAVTDGLTGVYNRLEIETRMQSAIERGAADGSKSLPSVVMLDLDDFKRVNDAYGHKAGDDVLRGLGELLRLQVDEAGVGVSGRWGGEEFMLVLPACDIKEACRVAEVIRSGFQSIDFPSSGAHTLSVGVARALPGESADLLSQRVDKALYAAKKNGKNRVIVA